jgi:hypothetical protein
MILDKNNVLVDFNDTVYSAVMIPNVYDYNGDCFTAEEIRDKMEDYMIKYRNFDINHDLKNKNEEIYIVENFLSPVEITIGEKTFPIGTWFMGLKIFSEKIKEDIRNGLLKGLSATAMQKTENPLVSFLSHKSKNIQVKRTFKELGDFDIIGVSLVPEPSYEDALFISFKEKDLEAENSHSDMKQEEKKEIDKISIKDKIVEAIKDESGIPKTQKEVKEEMTREDFLKLVEENAEAVANLISVKAQTEETEIEEKTETVEEVKEETPATEEVVEETVEEVKEDTVEIATKEVVEVKGEEVEVAEATETENVVENVEEEISTKSKEYETQIAELNAKIKAMEEENISLKNKSTQPDTSTIATVKNSDFDVFGRLKK